MGLSKVISSKRAMGTLCIICSAFCFALMNLFVRLSGDLPTFEKSFFRNAVTVFELFPNVSKMSLLANVYFPDFKY